MKIFQRGVAFANKRRANCKVLSVMDSAVHTQRVIHNGVKETSFSERAKTNFHVFFLFNCKANVKVPMVDGK